MGHNKDRRRTEDLALELARRVPPPASDDGILVAGPGGGYEEVRYLINDDALILHNASDNLVVVGK